MTEIEMPYVVAEPASDFFALMDRALNHDNAIEVIERLYALKEKSDAAEAKRAYNAAMTVAQAKIPVVARDAWNDQTKSNYSKLETIVAAVKPVYTEAGFSISFYEGKSDLPDHIRVMADVMHADGHTETKFADIPLDNAGIKGSVNKTGTHAKGSSFSYGRRYLVCLIFNIPTGDDDDGNGAGTDKITEEQAANIEALISETGANREAYLSLMKVKAVESIRAKDYENAIRWLEKKRNQKVKVK